MFLNVNILASIVVIGSECHMGVHERGRQHATSTVSPITDGSIMVIGSECHARNQSVLASWPSVLEI
jgi:hypothetical protein